MGNDLLKAMSKVRVSGPVDHEYERSCVWASWAILGNPHKGDCCLLSHCLAEGSRRGLLWGPSTNQEDLDEKSGLGEAHSHRALGRRIGTCGPLVICVYSSVWCVWGEGAGQPEVSESKPFEDRPSFWNGFGISLLAQCPTVVCILPSSSPSACVPDRNAGVQNCDVLKISGTKYWLSWAPFCPIAGTLVISRQA